MRERVAMMEERKKYWDLPMQANVPSLCERGGDQFVDPSYCLPLGVSGLPSTHLIYTKNGVSATPCDTNRTGQSLSFPPRLRVGGSMSLLA